MRSYFCLAFAFCAWVASAGAQVSRDTYSPKSSWTGFAAYANASSHMLIGDSQDQRLLLIGGSWNRREHLGKWMNLQYQAEVIPVAVLVSPYSILTQTVTYYPGAPPLPYLPAGTSTNTGVSSEKCFPENFNGFLYSNIIVGSNPPIGTIAVSQQCSRVATYGGGLSPLGERVNFNPHGRLQPFAVSNAGFLAFTRNLPNYQSTRFNFTFECGAGVEWHKQNKVAWALDARYHHTSNAFLGEQDPGIDNVIIRLSYIVPIKRH